VFLTRLEKFGTFLAQELPISVLTDLIDMLVLIASDNSELQGSELSI
jgi:hypothetical protein